MGKRVMDRITIISLTPTHCWHKYRNDAPLVRCCYCGEYAKYSTVPGEAKDGHGKYGPASREQVNKEEPCLARMTEDQRVAYVRETALKGLQDSLYGQQQQGQWTGQIITPGILPLQPYTGYYYPTYVVNTPSIGEPIVSTGGTAVGIASSGTTTGQSVITSLGSFGTDYSVGISSYPWNSQSATITYNGQPIDPNTGFTIETNNTT